MSDFHIIVFFNDYYTLIVAFLMKQIQNRYRNRRVATPLGPKAHPKCHYVDPPLLKMVGI